MRWPAIPFLAFVAACSDDEGGVPGDMFGTLSDGITEGMDDTGGDDRAGVDETGSEPVAIEGRCLFDPHPDGDRYGYRYQCEGSVALEIEITHPFAGSPVIEPFVLEFGSDVEGDDYESPLVMACCPWYDLDEPPCGQPHERACWIDVVEQGCKSLIGKLEAVADTFGILDLAKRKAVLLVADHVRKHQAECFGAFGGNVAGTLEQCDDNGNGQPFDRMIENGVWVFEPEGLVEMVRIDVHAASWSNLFPIGDDEPAPEICWSADENDGTSFLEVDPTAGEVMHLIAGSASVHGPSTEGTGELAPASLLAIGEGASPTLENLALHAAGAATVVVSGVPVSVDAFHIRLWDRVPMTGGGSTIVIAPRTARFAGSATALGESRVQYATNASPIIITRDASGWRTNAFTIDQTVGSSTWSIVIAPARWQ